ncbi:DEAD/DEAH box helicase [Sedimentibacter sp. LTW-03]|uniref:DEAD/DEAH box helicase n=1 Tax=Sedimentibacter sp. LTW-03 TaxID=3453406 RepID=UPI003F83F192
MIDINLFEFQEDTVSYLTEKTTDSNSKKKIIVKSCTGSGKTIVLVAFIEQFLVNADSEMIFCWFTPGKGDLEVQSMNKMEEYIPNAKTGNILDVLLQGFQPGYTYFINWEMITNKKNNALKDTERKNLFNRIAEAHRQNRKFIVIVDEEHLNDTAKANDILDALDHEKEIRVSATTRKIPTAEFYEIPEVEVINSGLITRALYINEGIDVTAMESLDKESAFLIEMADKKRKEIAKAYADKKEDIRPLIIVQFPNTSDRLIRNVENNLAYMGYNYDNRMVAKWLDNSKINITEITEDNAAPIFLLMKQAIATGWDCPRAKVLVKLRESMSENFEIQTLGRLRRMPRAKHYGIDILDFCYLYTFDERYKETVLSSGNAYEVRRLFLKDKCKTFSLPKEVRNRDYEYVNEKEVLDKAYNFFIDKYKLSKDKEKNKDIFINNGFVIGTEVFNKYRAGKFQKLADLAKNSIGEYHTISYQVSTHDHGIDCLHSVDMIKKTIGLPSNKTRAILQHLFHAKINSRKKLLRLSNREWYAFMINNAYQIRNDFTELASKPNEKQMQFLVKKEETFKLPMEDFYRYLPYERNVEELLSNAYKEYDTSMVVEGIRSKSERLFEYYCENNDDIDWVYKNGDTGQQYLSIVYGTNISKEYLFYPDYIIKKKNGNIWIIETKGGELKGKSKNIDKQIANKFIAFKDYAERNSINWGFVRDKNDRLYINNTKYSENMDDINWVKLADKF